MTERLYFDDSYRETFEATIEAIDGTSVVLDRTAFYPTGGGQPHDTGWLRTTAGEIEVVDVSGRDEIAHTLAAEPEVATGADVIGILDWDRRYALMRHHTTQHLLSAVLLEEFDAPTTGNQLHPDRARIDCAYPRFDADDLDRIEEAVNRHIAADHEVRTYVMDRHTAEADLDTERTRIDLLPDSVQDVRIVEIGPVDDPVDRTACAGTHVTATGEIPPMEVTGRETKGSDEERVRFKIANPSDPPG